MIDRNGVAVTVGARCKFRSDLTESWHEGTVRKLTEHTYYNPKLTRWEARVDDGDPARDVHEDNGFHRAAWVPSEDIEVISEAR